MYEELERLIVLMRRIGALKTQRVEDAVRAIPRHLFVPRVEQAYIDEPLPIDHGQTISQPSTVVIMTEALDARQGQRVLEIGTGSGWQAALLSYLVGVHGHVVTIERFVDMARAARLVIQRLGITNIDVREGDGTLGVPEEHFDRIIVTAAAPAVPAPLEEQLTSGGIMVIPIGNYIQTMYVYKKNKRLQEVGNLGQFRFVPLVGKYGF